MLSEIVTNAPVVLGTAVRPPLTPLTALIALGGLGLGGWLVWMGVFFDHHPSTSTTEASAPNGGRPTGHRDPG